MLKIKFTKGELKKQRDALGQYLRYLQALQLKKQHLQLEIARQLIILEQKRQQEKEKIASSASWAGLLWDKEIDIQPWLKPKQITWDSKNIAGIDLPVFKQAEFPVPEYDLFLAPLWTDRAIELFCQIVSLREELKVREKGLEILRQELRVASQRVNLFEKVKIPEARENIRMIKVYLGDQLANAVGRSKAAKRKIEQASLEEALV